jgi:hypothetical protein
VYTRLGRGVSCWTHETSPKHRKAPWLGREGGAVIGIWIIVGVAVAIVIPVIAWRRGRGRPADLGFVSSQWVAEHRLAQQHDTSR